MYFRTMSKKMHIKLTLLKRIQEIIKYAIVKEKQTLNVKLHYPIVVRLSRHATIF
jgi:hypothetical protein